MRNKKVAAALWLALAAGCASTGPNKGEFNLISLDQEKALGKQFNAEVHQQLKVIDTREATGYLQQLGERLVKGAPKTDFQFQFHLVDDPAVNAFAAPGGHIYVNTGLVAAADFESELAGVMGHEIAHAVERHVTEQMSKMYGAQLLATVALGQDAGMLTQLTTQLVGTAMFSKFSRDAERQSDRLAIQYLVNAGIDPRGLPSFFKKLKAEGGAPPRLLQWLSTHPVTDDRIKDANARIAKLSNLDRYSRDSAAFQRWKHVVAGRRTPDVGLVTPR